LPEIRPFAGVRYRLTDAELGRVLAPPYDVIPPDYAQELAGRHARNVVRLILNLSGDETGYVAAGAAFRAWSEDGTLAADDQPALYLLEQAFDVDGASFLRRGLIARFRAEEPERGVILPHEQTRRAAREDRYRMLSTTRANFSPIFLMFPDAEARFAACAARIANAPPTACYVDDGDVRHRLWRVSEPAIIGDLTRHLGAVRAYIADGHHRHATALRRRDEVGADGAWTLGYFTPIDDPGLLVLPYHRILRTAPDLAVVRGKLAVDFELTNTENVDALARGVAASRAAYAFGLCAPSGEGLLAEARPRAAALLPRDAAPCLRVLDTFFVHNGVLSPLLGVADEAIDYVHSLAEARQALATGRAALALLLRSTPVRQIIDVADARESMPAKSSFFHPKLPSGLVIHPLVA
jgi:uncharacterized protein (DUF1015 family)